jgi:endogenous inhibitor of DNA gyrase (YacG/DUF329 family)
MRYSPAVPLRLNVDCPRCGVRLVRKPAGRCPACGAEVARHVHAARAREERIERVVAVIGTALVLLVFAFTTGLGLVEGLLAYAGAGALIFFLATKTFR